MGATEEMRKYYTIYFYIVMFFIFNLTLLTLIVECILLWPILLTVKGSQSKILGRTFLFLMNVSFWMFKPFWKVKVLRPPPPLSEVLSKPTIIIANHQSKVDPWVLSNSIPGIAATYVVKHSLFKVPIAGWALWLSGALGIEFTKAKGGWGTDRSNVQHLMNLVDKNIHAGVSVIVFPEGTRSATGRIQPFKAGFFRYCIEHPEVRILPVGMHNNCKMWPLGCPLLDSATAYVSYGDYIESKGLTCEELMEKTRNAVFALMQQSPVFDPVNEQPINELAKQRDHGL